AHELNVPLSVVRARVRQWLDAQPPDHFLLIEADEELRKILAAEMQQAVTFPVQNCSPQDGNLAEVADGAIAVALSNHANAARQALPAGVELQELTARSVPASLAAWLPAPTGTLIAIASRWPEFLKLARTILTAAGFHKDSLLFRDVRKLDLTSETAMQFDSAKGKFSIPYASIDSYEYTQELTHHLGALPAIGVGLTRTRKHRHYFRIVYHDENNVSQIVVIEVPKHMPPVLQAVLKAR